MAEKRTMQPEDLFRLKFLQGGQLSPDGWQALYALAHVDAEQDTEYVNLWLVDVKSGQPRQLTNGAWQDREPQWSPDGQQIAFVSTRGEKPQIYLIAPDGGEARALTTLKQGVAGGVNWSPDGQRLAFTAGPQSEPRDPTRPFRVNRHIYRFDTLGYVDDGVTAIYVIDLATGETQRLTDDRFMNQTPQWSPDGQEILYGAMLQPDSHRTFNNQPRVVTLTGAVRNILPEGWGTTSGVAAWLPSGKQIVFIGVPEEAPLGAKSDLWVIDAQGGQPQNRTTGLAVGVGGRIQGDMPAGVPVKLDITADGKAAFTSVQASGMAQIYRIALSGKESYEPVLTGERSCMLLGMDTKQKALLFIVSTLNSPTELYISDIEGGNERRLTQLNDDLLSQIALPTVENLRFPSTDGTEVEGWILKPAVGQAPYPTVLYIHGGPFGAHGHSFSFDFQLLCGAGYATLAVNYRASMGYGDAFSTPMVGKWGTIDYQDLMAGVDFAIDKGISDADRLGVAGLSFGGYHSCWIITQTDRFKAAVPENPVVNWWTEYGVSDCVAYVVDEMGGHPWEIPDVYRQCSPLTFAHQCTTPTLLIQGEHDWRCPTPESEQFYAVLKAVGCKVEMLRFPNSFHGGAIRGAVTARRAQNAALLDWMNRFVLGKAPAQGVI